MMGNWIQRKEKKHAKLLLQKGNNLKMKAESVFSQSELAEKIAREAHKYEFRHGGVPYINHIQDVVNRLQSADDDTKAVTWLHDVVENHPRHYDIEKLRELGISSSVTDNVDILTHRCYESYEDYVEHVSKFPIARRVKIADILSNANGQPSPIKIRKYVNALSLLLQEEVDFYTHPGIYA